MEKNLNNNKDLQRVIKLTERVKQRLDFTLDGLTILTEVGSNFYIFTPIIPILCGASYVYAFVKDTAYGKAEDIKKKCIEYATSLGLQNKLEIGINNLDESWISKADIITNSGMLRPFDKSKLKLFKKGAVLPLMFEAWEIREQDLDIEECKRKDIRIAGTWENHPDLKVFDFVEMLCLKMAFEAGFEVQGNNVFVWSNDHFGEKIYNSLVKNGANDCYLSIDVEVLKNVAINIDFIFIADYDESRNYFELIEIEKLVKLNPQISIIHLYGNVNVEEFEKLGVSVYPKKNGKSELMTFTLAHVGMTPLINLQVGGYKVATEMIKNKFTNISQPIY
jgi:hypothetical protein